MIMTASLRPPNSLLFVMDIRTGEVPETMDGRLVVSTPSCIVIGTLMAADGETSVTLTDDKASVIEGSGLQRVFSGVLATPKKEVHVCTVLLQPVAKISVSSTQSNVEVWANSEVEPNRVCVLVNA
jgi:hypothetical protein